MTRPEIRVRVHDAAPTGWETLVAADPRADYFHTTHWLESAVASHGGLAARWLTADLEGRMVGGLALAERTLPGGRLPGLSSVRLDSSLEGTSGGPVIPTDLAPDLQAAVFDTLTEAMEGQRTGPVGIATVSLNGGHEADFGPRLARRPGWLRRDIPAAVISLAGGPDHVESHLMKKSKRNERNRGLRRGCEVFPTTDADLLAAYYPLYEQACAAWGQTPTPLAFLRALLNDPADRVFFTCVRVDRQVIGGHLNLHHGRRVIAWNGVTDPAFARTHFPATVAVWGDITEACRRGADELDLGASGGVVSLSGFKKFFGAAEEPRGFYRRPTRLHAVLDRLRNAGRSGSRRLHDGDPGGAA